MLVWNKFIDEGFNLSVVWTKAHLRYAVAFHDGVEKLVGMRRKQKYNISGSSALGSGGGASMLWSDQLKVRRSSIAQGVV